MKINKINEKINKAHELYKNQNFDEADKILSKLISNKIISDKIYFLNGLVNGAKNLNDQAAKNFKSAIKLNPKESGSYKSIVSLKTYYIHSDFKSSRNRLL